MYRFRISLPDSDRIRYGIPLTEALTTDLEPSVAYFVSANNLLKVEIPTSDPNTLSIDRESPIMNLSATFVTSFSYPIQSVCSRRYADEGKGYLCGIDERGHIKVFESDLKGNLLLKKEFTHQGDTNIPLEESWCVLRFSPSGKFLLSMHALSSSLNIYSLENQMNDPIIIHTVGHPNSVCWRNDETIIVTEQKQLSQFSIKGTEYTNFNRITVGSNNVTCICAFTTSDSVVACTEADRGVFGMNSSNLKIVKRWKAPIRSSVTGCIAEKTQSRFYGAEVEVVYLCGDDNEVLLFKNSGKEEKESALRERHSINIRSRSRIIGMTLSSWNGSSYLFVLGQNGDLDVIENPCDFLMERRKHKLESCGNREDKRVEMEE